MARLRFPSTALRLLFAASVIYLMLQLGKMASLDKQVSKKKNNLGTVNKTILVWNNGRRFTFGYGSNGFVTHGCQFTNCFLTDNELYLPTDKFDAIVFDIATLTTLHIESRSPHQRYVFFQEESVAMTDPDFDWDDFYNWTATYRSESDIHIPCGKFESKRRPEQTFVNGAVFQRKSKWVAWNANICSSPGRRENYIGLLRQYIPVDIYGPCGGIDSNRGYLSSYRMLEKEYRFYLSFENSLCTDYITDEVWEVMKYNIIPVVYGRVNYSEILPPHSFINARDFTPKKLAKKMEDVGHSKKEYMEYFKWKKNTDAISYRSKVEKILFCEVCRKLNEDERVPIHEDFYGWWRNNKCEDLEETIYANETIKFLYNQI